MQNGEDFWVKNVDPSTLTILYIALWMNKNHEEMMCQQSRWNP